MKLLHVFPKENYNVLSPSSYAYISVRDLYVSRTGLTILLQENIWTDPENILSLTNTLMWKLGLRPCNSRKKKYLIGIFVAVHYQKHARERD
jgi:hypothetical protein